MSSIPSFEYPVPLHANVSTQLGVEMPTGSWELAYLSMTTAGVWDAMIAAACCKNKYAKAALGIPRGEEKRESGVEVASSERLMAEVGAGCSGLSSNQAPPRSALGSGHGTQWRGTLLWVSLLQLSFSFM